VLVGGGWLKKEVKVPFRPGERSRKRNVGKTAEINDIRLVRERHRGVNQVRVGMIGGETRYIDVGKLAVDLQSN